MLFNLTTHTSFPCKDPYGATTCRKVIGPFFGGRELSASEPFNEERACCSKANRVVYKIPRNSKGINMLTNQKCNKFDDRCNFTITEIEVWGVNFIK